MDLERAVDISNNQKIRVQISNAITISIPIHLRGCSLATILYPRSTQFETSHLYVAYKHFYFVRIHRYF